MNLFSYTAATDAKAAMDAHGLSATSAYLGGGTNLLDDMKLGIEGHDHLVDVRKALDNKITFDKNGLHIGAAVTNSALAYDENVIKNYPALSQALLSGASPQLRNAATTAGNLLQRTRCYYFRDANSRCNKRNPGSGCDAIDGFNRIHAILGTSEKCIATHPSDMDVAMVAFDARIHVNEGPQNGPTNHSLDMRRNADWLQWGIPIADFYVSYGDDPAKENVLKPGTLITAVSLPSVPWFAKSAYMKARDRASYEFALSSAAVALDIQSGTINDCRVALGGVATKPWRAFAAEKILKGGQPNEDTFKAAAAAELQPAVPQKHNAFKIELCKRLLVQTLKNVAAMA